MDLWWTYQDATTQYSAYRGAYVKRDLQQVLAHELDHLVNGAPNLGEGIFTPNTELCQGFTS